MSDDEIRKIANEHTVEYDSDDGETSHSLDLYSFSRAIRREALEEAANACDVIAVDRWNLYKGRAPYTGAEAGRAQDHVQGESDGADSCAAAIRALSKDQAK